MALPAPYHCHPYPLPWLYLPLTMATAAVQQARGRGAPYHSLLTMAIRTLTTMATRTHTASPALTYTPQQARGLRYLFHGAGSANLGSASLLINEAKVPQSQVARHVETRPPLLSPWPALLSQDGRLP